MHVCMHIYIGRRLRCPSDRCPPAHISLRSALKCVRIRHLRRISDERGIFFNIQRHGDNTPEISCALCVCETGRRRDMRETVAGVLHNMRRAAIVLFWRVVLATIVGICKRHYIVRRHVFSVVDRDRLRASAIIWNCIVILIAVGCLMPR